MSLSMRPVLLVPALLLTVLPCPAQQREDVSDRPLRALTRAELDRREAMFLYARAVDHEHRNNLPEALRTFEKAARLDPESASILRSLIPLYQALDRQRDALDVCRRITTLEPTDYETWHTTAKLHRAMDQDAEARKALVKAVACKAIHDNPEVHLSASYDLAVLHEKFNDLKSSEASFREVIALLERPSAAQEQGGMSKEDLVAQIADTYERVGRLCLKAEQTDRAVEAFRKAQAADPIRTGRLSFNLAEVFAAQKKDAQALGHLDIYLSRQPQGTEGYELKLTLLRRMKRQNEILPALERASRDDVHHLGLKMLLAREYQAAKRDRDAERVWLGLTATPSPEAYRGLFGLYRTQGDRGAEKVLDRLNSAIAAAYPDEENKKPAEDAAGQASHARAMLTALREEPELIASMLPIAMDRLLKGPKPASKTRLYLGVLAERTRQLDKAEQLYRSCLDAEGRVRNFGIRKQSEAEVYGGLLRVLMLARKHESVVELCKQGLEHAEATNRVLFHLDHAHALMGLGKTKEAIEASKLAVDTAADRDRLTCRRSHAGLLAQAGMFKEAEAECLALLKDFKDDDVRSIRFTLSLVYSMSKQHEKSEEQLLVVLEADPADAHANNDLGYQWADRNKKLDEAERMIRKAIELDRQERNAKDALSLDADRDNAAYVDSLGWVLFRRGKLKEAREQLEKASRLPDGAHDPVVWDHLGDVCLRMKDVEKARTAWRKALKLYDEGHRPKHDERWKDIEEKLKQTR